jgi:xylulokinase
MGQVYRASHEAITLEFVRSLAEMRRQRVLAERILSSAGGRAARYGGKWRPMRRARPYGAD